MKRVGESRNCGRLFRQKEQVVSVALEGVSRVCIVLVVGKECSCKPTDLTSKKNGAANDAGSYGGGRLGIVASKIRRTEKMTRADVGGGG